MPYLYSINYIIKVLSIQEEDQTPSKITEETRSSFNEYLRFLIAITDYLFIDIDIIILYNFN